MSNYFDARAFTFLRQLRENNTRTWFMAHREEYEQFVREPFLRLLGDLQPALSDISSQFEVDMRRVGGSLFRIQRDARFSKDKSPYKPWQGARLFHARRREVPAPAFYLHLQPGSSFVGAGLWHPEPAVQKRVRQFIFDNPAGWESAAHVPRVRKEFSLERDGAMVRPPRGFPADWPRIDDLKLRSWAMLRPLDDAAMTAPNLRDRLEADLRVLAPFVDYLCAALDLEF
ncbi:DUF2461 domain-containing protein [Xanthomonadaceae bacterium JHOS43]|nr:DUF2461 domain-containing protein [Xanthomonadaceae bacterium JHOS43]MCX7563798.1 DUF2461 domain-containing protein [Xanthomonadaceae bacterium XH05]